jgi:hypothetical protein
LDWAHVPDLGFGRRPKLHGMQGVRGSNPLSSTLGLDEHGRAQHLAVTSSASDRAIALTWQMAPWRSMMPRKVRAVDDVAPEH